MRHVQCLNFTGRKEDHEKMKQTQPKPWGIINSSAPSSVADGVQANPTAATDSMPQSTSLLSMLTHLPI
jgi:hypothetical protein